MSGVAWRLPGYRIERLLGAGASGEVWQARISATGEPVALKRIAIGDPVELALARSEVAKLAALDHPHLVRLHDFAIADGAIVLVLDLAGGGSLAELVQARGRLTPGEVITAVAPIAAALAYSHAAGVVHGDVTPANVVFTEDGLPLLTDLGVARLAGDTAPVQTTPAFVDPSVVAGCLPGPASDVFMIAAVALYALTGEALWPGVTAEDALAAALDGAALADVEDRLRAARVPEPMAVVLARALAADAPLRGTAADFALDLRHSGEPIAVELTAGCERIEAGRPSFERPAAPGPRHAARTPLTRGVRPPTPRAFVRPPRQPWWRHRALRRGGIGAAAVLLAAVLAGVLWWQIGTAATPHRQAAPPSPPATAPSSHPAAAVGVLDATAAVRVLAALDAYRQQAFARRDPALLAKMYPPGPLLAQDQALLTRIVPSGCGLLGVHTEYRDAAVTSRTSQRTELRVRAVLQPSTLRCGKTPGASAPGAGPTPLLLVLNRSGSGYLISEVHPAAVSSAAPSAAPAPAPGG